MKSIIAMAVSAQILICPVCHKENKKSRVFESGVQTTLAMPMNYYDENGNYIRGVDPNYTIYSYRCSNGHSFEVKK